MYWWQIGAAGGWSVFRGQGHSRLSRGAGARRRERRGGEARPAPGLSFYVCISIYLSVYLSICVFSGEIFRPERCHKALSENHTRKYFVVVRGFHSDCAIRARSTAFASTNACAPQPDAAAGPRWVFSRAPSAPRAEAASRAAWRSPARRCVRRRRRLPLQLGGGRSAAGRVHGTTASRTGLGGGSCRALLHRGRRPPRARRRPGPSTRGPLAG